MKLIRPVFIVLVTFILYPLFAQEAVRVKSPPIPREMYEPERAILTQSADLLAKGEFDPVTAMLKPLALHVAVKVHVNWTPVPMSARDEYRKMVQQAIDAWNQGLEGVRFRLTRREKDADLLILFEWDVAQITSGQIRLSCVDMKLDTSHPGAPVSRRKARVRIALNVPYKEEIHSPASVAHLVGQGLGAYLGLSPTQNKEDLMGPDTHEQEIALKPSENDLGRVREIQQSRLDLMDCARKHALVYVPKPGMVVDRTEDDAGDVWKGENPRFVFKIRNTGEAPLEITAKPNCGCVVPRYDRVIEAGAEGTLEAELRTTGFRGRISKSIAITSNDPEKPRLSLRLTANVMSVVHVLPAESLQIPLKDNEPTVREIQIRGSDPVEISRVICSSPYATATVQPLEDENSKERAYKVTVTVRPDAPIGRSSFMVTAFTTSPREPRVNVTAICEKGILSVPVSVYMGSIRSDTPLPLKQIISLMKREGSFHIQKVSCDDQNLEVQQGTVQEGSRYRITLTYRAGAASRCWAVFPGAPALYVLSP